MTFWNEALFCEEQKILGSLDNFKMESAGEASARSVWTEVGNPDYSIEGKAAWSLVEVERPKDLFLCLVFYLLRCFI